MDKLQRVYLRFGETENKRAAAVEVEGLESKINNTIEKAEQILRDINFGKRTHKCI